MSFFNLRRGGQSSKTTASQSAPAESLEIVRKRAKHRLIGSAVLVLLGVIGFPLLFDTQPRPVSVGIPIEIPSKQGTKPLSLPAAEQADAGIPQHKGQADEALLKKLIEDHHRWTGSLRAREILDNWSTAMAKFVKVFPNEYKRALGEINAKKAAKAAKSAEPAAAIACPADVPAEVFVDFLTIRKSKRAPLTNTALAGIRREADKAGLSLADALAVCCERGWVGFRADWHSDSSCCRFLRGRDEISWFSGWAKRLSGERQCWP